MSIIKNVVGLARFLVILFSLALPHKIFLPHKRHVVERQTGMPTEAKKYPLENVIGPTESLTMVQPIFCPKCHARVCWKGNSEDGTVIIDNNRNTTTINNITVVGKDGKNKESGLPMQCPNGHKVVVK